MNHPLKAIRLKVAGAAHILMWKYLSANALTSSEHWTNTNISFWKGHWIKMRSKADSTAALSPLLRLAAQAPQSSRP